MIDITAILYSLFFMRSYLHVKYNSVCLKSERFPVPVSIRDGMKRESCENREQFPLL